jgi:hypothetical protein
MAPKYFRDGNYIYECKSSPDQIGSSVNQNSLRKWVNDVDKVLKENKPSGFRYIFPVNRLSDENQKLIDQLRQKHSGVDIQCYDCDSVDRLVKSLNKVNHMSELVEYIEEARG